MRHLTHNVSPSTSRAFLVIQLSAECLQIGACLCPFSETFWLPKVPHGFLHWCTVQPIVLPGRRFNIWCRQPEVWTNCNRDKINLMIKSAFQSHYLRATRFFNSLAKESIWLKVLSVTNSIPFCWQYNCVSFLLSCIKGKIFIVVPQISKFHSLKLHWNGKWFQMLWNTLSHWRSFLKKISLFKCNPVALKKLTMQKLLAFLHGLRILMSWLKFKS